MRQKIQSIVEAALKRAVAQGDLSLEGDLPSVEVELPRNPEHGDFATGLAMQLARPARKNPRQIAQLLIDHLEDPEGVVEKVEIAGPGFLNFRLKPAVWFAALDDVFDRADAFGRAPSRGKKVLVEFVSANPTGPLHVGHGRGAVTGDVISTLLDWAGWDVTREYYVNDAGNQVEVLAGSVHVRYRQLFGEEVSLPEDAYPGDYVIEVAEALKARDGDKWLTAPESEWRPALRQFAIDRMVELIKADLGAFNIRFDRFASERWYHDEGLVKQALEDLRGRGLLYEEDGGVLFRSSDFGDDKDRAVEKKDGTHTYLASDIAYHREKLERGYDLLVNVWGADHGGYVPRMRAAIEALGRDPDMLHVVLVQMVNLTREGQPVRMGKRSGEFVTLREVIDEVGRDATRFFFIMRRSDAQFDFDLELAKRQSMDNPVYYMQYGHARIASILRKAAEAGHPAPEGRPDEAALTALGLPEEIDLAKRSLNFPEVVQGAAEAQEPHRIVYYLQETIAAFHAYYTKYKNTERVVSDDAVKTTGRLYLVAALKQVLRNGLEVLGVDAPEEMARADADEDAE